MPIHASPKVMRARLDVRRLGHELVWVGAISLALTALRPLGVLQDEPAGLRLFYWARTLGMGYLLHRPLFWLGARLALASRLPEWSGWLMGMVAAAVPMALFLWFFGPTPRALDHWPSERLLAETTGQVLTISLLVAVCLWSIDSLLDLTSSRQNEAEPLPKAPDVCDAAPALAARLPGWTRERILALEGEDHYVRVHTDRGSHLLLIRLADAAGEAADLDLYQVHRSWWVAREAVARMETEGRNGRLHLVNGLCVPVARNRLRDVRLWLDEVS